MNIISSAFYLFIYLYFIQLLFIYYLFINYFSQIRRPFPRFTDSRKFQVISVRFAVFLCYSVWCL